MTLGLHHRVNQCRSTLGQAKAGQVVGVLTLDQPSGTQLGAVARNDAGVATSGVDQAIRIEHPSVPTQLDRDCQSSRITERLSSFGSEPNRLGTEALLGHTASLKAISRICNRPKGDLLNHIFLR